MLWSCWLSPSTLPPYLRRSCPSWRSRTLRPSPKSLRQQPRAQWISFARSPPLCDAAGLLSRMSKSADRRGAHAFIEGNKSADHVISSAVPGSNSVRCSARRKRLTFAHNGRVAAFTPSSHFGNQMGGGLRPKGGLPSASHIRGGLHLRLDSRRRRHQ